MSKKHSHSNPPKSKNQGGKILSRAPPAGAGRSKNQQKCRSKEFKDKYKGYGPVAYKKKEDPDNDDKEPKEVK